MLDYRLSRQELAELRAAHRRALNVREAYRINAVILLGNGRTAADVADALLIEMHHAFKRANGYSELEISRKRTALENVLIPETVAAHRQRLHDVGFSRSAVWLRYFNFVSIVAIK